MQTVRYIVVALVLCAFASSPIAQEGPCDTSKIKNLELRGLHLGMTLSEVQAKIKAKSKIDFTNEFGHTRMIVDFRKSQWSPLYKGLFAASLEFIDRRLSVIRLYYDDSVTWDTDEQFLSRISESLGIPDAWEASPRLKNWYHFRCGDFRFNAGFTELGGKTHPFLDFINLKAGEAIDNRIDQKLKDNERREEEKRKTFRP